MVTQIINFHYTEDGSHLCKLHFQCNRAAVKHMPFLNIRGHECFILVTRTPTAFLEGWQQQQQLYYWNKASRVQTKQHEQQQQQQISKKMEKIIKLNHLLCKLLESSPRPFKIQRQVLIFSKDFREESAQRNDNRKKESLLIFAFSILY